MQGIVCARVEDVAAARRAASALRGAGFAEDALRIRGRRVPTTVSRPARGSHWPRRLRVNVAVALICGMTVGPPLGATSGALLFDEAPAAMWAGGIVLALVIGIGGSAWAWAEHHQLTAGSILPSHVEGIVACAAPSPGALQRAAALLATLPGVLEVASMPADAAPIASRR